MLEVFAGGDVPPGGDAVVLAVHVDVDNEEAGWLAGGDADVVAGVAVPPQVDLVGVSCCVFDLIISLS